MAIDLLAKRSVRADQGDIQYERLRHKHSIPRVPMFERQGRRPPRDFGVYGDNRVPKTGKVRRHVFGNALEKPVRRFQTLRSVSLEVDFIDAHDTDEDFVGDVDKLGSQATEPLVFEERPHQNLGVEQHPQR